MLTEGVFMRFTPKVQRLFITAFIVALLEIVLFYVSVAVDHYYPRNTSAIVVFVINFLFLLEHYVRPTESTK